MKRLSQIDWPIAWTVFRVMMYVLGFMALSSYLLNLTWILASLGFILFFGCWYSGYSLLVNLKYTRPNIDSENWSKVYKAGEWRPGLK